MKMKYTEQAVETLDDAGSVIANKNIEIEQLRQRVAELEKKNNDLWESFKLPRNDDILAIEALTAERDALKQQRDELVMALEDSVSVAKDALDHWDQDRDMKVGKLLHALSGLVKGYDSRADAVHNAIASVKEKA